MSNEKGAKNPQLKCTPIEFREKAHGKNTCGKAYEKKRYIRGQLKNCCQRALVEVSVKKRMESGPTNERTKETLQENGRKSLKRRLQRKSLQEISAQKKALQKRAWK